MLETIDFPYTLYQENILILGMQGSGKTTLARDLLGSEVFYSAPRVIWSPQRPTVNFGGYGEPCADMSEISDKGAYLWVGDFGTPTFERLCRHLMTKCYNMVLIVDDAHEQVSKHRINPEFGRLVNSGRNRGLCSIFISPYPNLLTNQLLQACRHRFCFRLDLETQVDWVSKNIYGKDAWLLTPRDMRKFEPTQHADLDTLPEHSFLYRFDGHSSTQVVLSEPAPALHDAASDDEGGGGRP